jgi:hypothetical protein
LRRQREEGRRVEEGEGRREEGWGGRRVPRRESERGEGAGGSNNGQAKEAKESSGWIIEHASELWPPVEVEIPDFKLADTQFSIVPPSRIPSQTSMCPFLLLLAPLTLAQSSISDHPSPLLTPPSYFYFYSGFPLFFHLAFFFFANGGILRFPSPVPQPTSPTPPGH